MRRDSGSASAEVAEIERHAITTIHMFGRWEMMLRDLETDPDHKLVFNCHAPAVGFKPRAGKVAVQIGKKAYSVDQLNLRHMTAIPRTKWVSGCSCPLVVRNHLVNPEGRDTVSRILRLTGSQQLQKDRPHSIYCMTKHSSRPTRVPSIGSD